MPDQSATIREVINVVAETFSIDPTTIGPATTAEDVDGWDSVSHTILILALEERLGVVLPFGETIKLPDLGSLSKYIDERRT